MKSDVDQDDLRELLEYNLHKSDQELAHDLNNISQIHHLKKIGKMSKLQVRDSHSFSEKNKDDCISIAISLLLR